MFVSSDSVGRAFFRNVGTTRRQSIERELDFVQAASMLMPNYAFIDATFQTALTQRAARTTLSPMRPAIYWCSQETGSRVFRGIYSRLGTDYGITGEWVVGFSGLVASGKYLVGDEFKP